MKTQISQCIRAVWSEYLLGAFGIAKGAKFLIADNKDWSACAQTDLIFVGRTCQQIRFLMMRLNIVSYCFLNTSLPKLFPYYYQSNQFPENYHSGSYFGLSPSRVNYLATSPVTKANQIEPVCQRTITRAHVLDYLPPTWSNSYQYLLIIAIKRKQFLSNMSWVIKQLYNTFLCDSQNYQPQGAVEHLMNYRPRPSASGDSSLSGPQHFGIDNFDCRPERYEILVYCYFAGKYITPS